MKRLILLYAFAFVVPALAGEPGYSARVVGVKDGDMLTVLTADKRQVKIRLHGIDAPESSQDFGQRAKQAASDLAFGKTVRIEPKDTDRYGRTVAVVILPDGTDLNREMVERGMAWHDRKFDPDDVILARAQVCAKKVKLGIWSQPGAIPPWEWRKSNGFPPTAVIGNRSSRLYHAPSCRGAIGMSPKDRVVCESAELAEELGYRRARDCR